MTKKNVLWISSGYIVYFVSLFLLTVICDSSWCRIHDDDLLGIILFAFSPLLPVFFFSLITYRLHDTIFLAWRDFSTWWIPLTIFLVLITPDSHSVIMSWGKEVPAIGMSALYVLISAIIIFRAYRATKSKN